MSADNWEVCPRCFDRAQAAADERKHEVTGMYGSVPIEEFEAARAALKDPNPEDFRTFREDYEFYGADTGVLKIEYQGGCSNCGLSCKFGASEKFWPDGNDR